MKRRVFTLRWDRTLAAWLIKRGTHTIIGGAPTRQAALRLATAHCRRLAARDVACQLVIFNRGNQRISEERTYLHDPRRYPG